MLQGLTATGERCGEVGQPFGEDLSWARRGKTAEATHLHGEDDAPTTDRQIRESASIARANPLRAAVAQGATGAASLDREGESNGIGVDGDVLDLQRSEMRKKLFDVHENLRDDGVGPDDTVCIQCTLRQHRESGRAPLLWRGMAYQRAGSCRAQSVFDQGYALQLGPVLRKRSATQRVPTKVIIFFSYVATPGSVET